MPAKRIRTFRRAKGLTQRKLAGLLGVDPHTVYLWERGTRTPPYARLVDIAKKLDVKPTVFFSEKFKPSDD